MGRVERIGYLREAVARRIGRIYPAGEVRPRGPEVEAEAKEREGVERRRGGARGERLRDCAARAPGAR